MSSKKKIKPKRIPRKPTEYAVESRAIRISPELDLIIREVRRRNESYDNVLRRMLGFPVTKYTDKTAFTFYVVDTGNNFFTDESEALGEAVMAKVRTGKKAQVKKVRTVI